MVKELFSQDFILFHYTVFFGTVTDENPGIKIIKNKVHYFPVDPLHTECLEEKMQKKKREQEREIIRGVPKLV